MSEDQSVETTEPEAVATEAAAPETAPDAGEPSPENASGAETGEETAAPPAATGRPSYASANQGEFSDSLSQRSDTNQPRVEVEGGRPYEIIYISRMGDAEATDAGSQRLKELVEGFGGAIDNVRASEVRRLAYPIKREVEGLYIVVNIRIQPVHLPEVDRFFKLEESIIRHMIIKD